MACDVCNEVCGTVVQPVKCVTCGSGKIDLPDLALPIVPPGFKPITLPTVSKITEEKLDGTGVFDVYMRAGMNQLNTQYDKGRIKGADFASAYIETMQLMMVEANKFVIGIVQAEAAARMFDQQYLGAQYDNLVKMHSVSKTKAEADLICTQIEELSANGAQDRSLKAAQTSAQCKTVELYDRQIDGFDEKNQHDIFKTIMDAWAIQGVDIAANQTLSVVSEFNSDPMGKLVKSAIKETDLTVV